MKSESKVRVVRSSRGEQNISTPSSLNLIKIKTKKTTITIEVRENDKHEESKTIQRQARTTLSNLKQRKEEFDFTEICKQSTSQNDLFAREL